jgi:hypothetical protein
MPRAYVDLPINKFLQLNPDEVMGQLSNAHPFDLEMNQRNAWQYQIQHLRQELNNFTEGRVFFEFSIPRMGKRADVILSLKNIIFILEYKVGANQGDRSGLDQVHDYALDLKNFHVGSHECHIVPILIPTETEQIYQVCQFEKDKVASPITISPERLATILSETLRANNTSAMIPSDWSSSSYKPTPTIIEAAKTLFAGHSVKEITRSESGAINLDKTASAALAAINDAKINKKKSLIFISGVPGSGKTLAGLEIATSSRRESDSDNEGVFLTGNGPLADVLREALARDEVERTGILLPEAMRKAKTFIQNIHHFRDEYLSDTKPPYEKVVVFDEAQRAWNLEATERFMRLKRGIADFDQSEPEFLLSVMARHPDWCAVICLIGNGQEINKGEAGVSEWIKAAEKLEDHWNIYFSDQLHEYEEGETSDLFQKINPSFIIHNPELHLKTSIRSFRSERLSEFVGKILDGNVEQAKTISRELENYPLFISRNLFQTKNWLKIVSRGSERYGLVASSNAIRLKPYGLHMKSKIDPARWFLANKDDIRSSFYLEDAASEFDIQGLELDWIGLCWDANLRRNGSNWSFHNFAGTRWQNVARPEKILYLINSYRVLMTRARQGMVIFVPEGNPEDHTRKSEFYDPIYDYLLSCGFNKLGIS